MNGQLLLFCSVLSTVSVPVQDGWTALHAACAQGRDEVVQTLMIAKADLNLQTNVSTSTVQLIIVSADDHRHKLGKTL